VTPAEVAELRTLLVQERERLESSLATIREDGNRTMDEEVGVPGGVGADTASVTFERELGSGLEEEKQQALVRIDQALARIDEGTYGTCERCGKPIAHERLLARPSASLCIDDQRLVDRG
jgi:RNA polymerase-binding protein DksA